MKKESPKKVVLVYYALLHYRQSLFEYLADAEEIDFQIVCGLKSQFPDSKYYQPSRSGTRIIKNYFFKIFGKLFYIQVPLVRILLKESPDVLILRGVNPQIISSLYAFLFMKLFRRKTKIYWWGHGTLGHQGWFGIKFRSFFYKYANGVLLQGKKGIKILMEAGIAKKKIHVVGNNMNDSDLGYKIENIHPKIITQSLRINFTGRLVKNKNVELLLTAIRILLDKGIDIRVDIVGEGPSDKMLKELMKELDLKSVVNFTGAKYGEELRGILRTADLMVIPDYTGLSIIHGLSYGVPFITSDDLAFHGPEIEVLIDGENGSLYQKDDVNELVNEILVWKEKLSKPNNISEMCINSITEYTTNYVGNNILEIIK